MNRLFNGLGLGSTSLPTCAALLAILERKPHRIGHNYSDTYGGADQWGWNSFHAPCGLKAVILSDHFLPVSMMHSSFSRVQLCQGCLIYFHTSDNYSEMALIITPGSQYDSKFPFQSLSPKHLHISYKLAKLSVPESACASSMKETLI